MSFQAYLSNIKEKTGKGPDDFKKLAEQKGFVQDGTIKPEVKAGDIVKWLKEDFDLGHGHSMAIYALLKGAKNEKSQ
ncbi:MAG: DUF4287 domain-containing protein [Segetibacter sp.]